MRWVEAQPNQVDILCPRISTLSEALFAFAAKHQKPLYAWVSDDPAVLKKWGDHPQIHGLATNNPELFFSVYPKVIPTL